jgi:hypothetical protein
MLTYALPGSLVMAESTFGWCLSISIFALLFGLLMQDLYPMAVSLFPLMMDDKST